MSPSNLPQRPGLNVVELGMASLSAMLCDEPISPSNTLEAIEATRYDACLGRASEPTNPGSDAIDRLVAAYALLRLSPDPVRRPVVMWETLEGLGYSVSVDFAERGSDGYHLYAAIRHLEQGKALDAMQLDMAYQCLGRLWATAFSAPSGYDNYIAKSAAGREKPPLSFFAPIRRPEELSPSQEARYLCRLLDLLQCAICAENLPSAYMGSWLRTSAEGDPAWRMSMPRRGPEPWTIDVHVRSVQTGDNVAIHHVWLVEQGSRSLVGHAVGTVIEGDSGSYDDFLSLSAQAGEIVEEMVDSVFSPDQVVSLYPRVREILDAADNRLFRLLCIQELAVEPQWRGQGIAEEILQQLLGATDMVDLAIIRPEPCEVGLDDDTRLKFAVQAGFGRAKLKVANVVAAAGGEFLISGTMGIRMDALRRLHAKGELARTKISF